MENRIMMSDSYKYSHTKQYPSNMVKMFDYAEARSDKEYNKTVFFGLQYILKRYFSEPIEMREVIEAKNYAEWHGIPFELKGWTYIVEELGGMLPIRIKAVPEGSVMPTRVPLMTIESTDEYVPWVVSWLETTILKVWYTSNIATRSYFVKKMLTEYAEQTMDVPFVDYQYHNFGYRGSSTEEAGFIGGVAHLTQFMGTDNFNSMRAAKQFYFPNTIDTTWDELMEIKKNFFTRIGHSIPATEHSSTTSWGKDAEFDMIMNHIEQNKGVPLIAAVMDSYNYFEAVDTITGTERFRTKIDSDEYPIFVIRPDSGNPKEIIPKTIDIMEENGVPFTVNNKGFKVWNKFRIIWGDGITMESMKDMLDIMISRGYSTENIAFGSGGWLMQQHDRDTQGWAVKCSSITLDEGSPIDNEDGTTTWEPFYVDRDVFKDPITAPGKVSKKGKITTYFNRATEEYESGTIGQSSMGYPDIMETVYENGVMVKEYSLEEVRENSKI